MRVKVKGWGGGERKGEERVREKEREEADLDRGDKLSSGHALERVVDVAKADRAVKER